MKTQDMRYYVRLDSRNLPIVGSLVARKKMPVLGKWVDTTQCAILCCAPTTTSTTTVAPTTTTTTTTTLP